MHSLLRTASLHITCVLKWSGTYGLVAHFLRLKVLRDCNYPTGHVYLCPEDKFGSGLNFMDTKNDTILMPFMLHFHKPHFHGLVHCQGLSCSPYAQKLKQGQENYQTYTLKDNLK